MNLENFKKKFQFLNNLGLGSQSDYFVENLATLVSSGMTINDAISVLIPDIRSKRMQEIAKDIGANVEAGFPLWRALENSTIFPKHVVSLVRIGEESGKLSQNLHVVSAQQAKEREFRSKVRSAMLYPAFVLGLAFVIGIGIAWFILPKLARIFSQLKLELPLVTRAMINLGKFLGTNGSWVIPLFIFLLVLFIYFLFYFPKTKFIGQNIIFFLPGVRRLVLEVELYRFGFLFGTLLETGLPVTEALSSISRVTFSPFYKNFYDYLAKSIEEGNSFEKSFRNYSGIKRIMPASVTQLIVVGEKSGNLSRSLISIGKSYESKIETTTKNLSVILEPIMLVIVWFGVMAVAFSVILPIYSLIGGIRT